MDKQSEQYELRHVQGQNSRKISKQRQRQWLKSALVQIQDHVADDAAIIGDKMTQSKVQNSDYSKNGKVKFDQKTKSLTQLKQQQDAIRHKLREIKAISKIVKTQHKKYNETKQFKVKSNAELRQLTKMYKQFKQNLLQKSRVIKLEEQQQKQQTKKLQQERKKCQCQQRRKNIEQTLQKMAKRRAQRLQEHQKQKIKLKQLKKQKLFQKMKQNYMLKASKMSELEMRRYKTIKKMYSVDMSKLSLHEKSYEKERANRLEKRTLRMTESRVLPELNVYKSRFFDQITQYEKQEKQRLQQQAVRKKSIKRKHKEFYQKVVQEHPLVIKQKDLSEQENKQNEKHALDWKQFRKKGNQLYKQGQKHILPAQKRHKKQQNELNIKQKKTYPNYLHEITKKINQTALTASPYSHQLQHIESVLHSKVHTNQKVQQVRLLMQKMESDNQIAYGANSSQQELIDRLNFKMKLLQILS